MKDVNTDSKKVVPKPLNVNERLDRLERLIVRALLALPADVSRSRMINVEAQGRVTANALNKRFYQYESGTCEAREYALKCVLDMCTDDIAAAQIEQDAADAKAKAIKREAARAAAEEAKRIAEDQAKNAQAELDALTEEATNAAPIVVE